MIFSVGLTLVKAQSPNKINYQAVARNTETGIELSNQSIFVIVKIRNNGANGTIVYQEEHPNIQTNEFGLFTISIGGGEAVTGTFQNIQWQTGNYWLQIDLDAGSGMESMGTMQFVTVPYAFHAETATHVDDADADPQNELVEEFIFNPDDNTLSIVQAGSTLTQELSSLLDDADADPENEFVDSLDFDPASSILSLYQPESVLTQDLSALIDDADADTTNEAISSIQLSGTNLIVQEAETWTVNLSQLADDADADPENELISIATLTNDTLLTILEGGSIHNINFSGLQETQYWEATDNGTVISNVSEKVGVGTANPTSTLDVNGSISYGVTILENQTGTFTYSVAPTDHIIICKMTVLNTGSITIDMPPAITCEGREIIIRKTGLGPIFPAVFINFGSDLLDYLPLNNQLNEGKETAAYISLGSDGWTRLFKN